MDAVKSTKPKVLYIACVLITSPQELRVGIASVNSDVAHGAIPISRVSHVVRRGLRENARSGPARTAAGVAFQTYCEQNRPFQKARIRRSVRKMAGFTTVDANRG